MRALRTKDADIVLDELFYVHKVTCVQDTWKILITGLGGQGNIQLG